MNRFCSHIIPLGAGHHDAVPRPGTSFRFFAIVLKGVKIRFSEKSYFGESNQFPFHINPLGQ